MDILQTHFLQKKNRNKLFFKVDMGDLRVTYNDDEACVERENNTCKVSISNSLNLAGKSLKNREHIISSLPNHSMKKSVMEDIKESKEHSDMGKGS